MRELFEELKRDGSDAIHRWVAERKQESVQLDFKQKKRPQHGELDKDDRQILGPALSALANSAGGMIVLGVQADKNNPDKIDAASKTYPIKDIVRLKNDATRAVAELLSPRHESVEIEMIEEKSAPGTGYLAIWVERSERRPHRSEAANDKRYYKRAGDSSFVMEHYDIEDAFKRNAVATLGLQLESVASGAGNSDHNVERQEFKARFVLRNVGSVSARAPYVVISNLRGAQAIPVIASHPNVRPPKLFLDQATLSGGVMFSADAGTLVHPELHIPAFDLLITLVRPRATQWHHNNVPIVVSALSFDFGFGCEHSKMIRGTFDRMGREFVKLFGQLL